MGFSNEDWDTLMARFRLGDDGLRIVIANQYNVSEPLWWVVEADGRGWKTLSTIGVVRYTQAAEAGVCTLHPGAYYIDSRGYLQVDRP